MTALGLCLVAVGAKYIKARYFKTTARARSDEEGGRHHIQQRVWLMHNKR